MFISYNVSHGLYLYKGPSVSTLISHGLMASAKIYKGYTDLYSHKVTSHYEKVSNWFLVQLKMLVAQGNYKNCNHLTF